MIEGLESGWCWQGICSVYRRICPWPCCKCVFTASAKAKKLSLQIPTRMVSDRLEIVHHHTLSFDLELEELQKRQNERYWTVILSLLKKNNSEVWWECCALGCRSVLIFTDAWWISGFKCFIKTIHLVAISKEDCLALLSPQFAF